MSNNIKTKIKQTTSTLTFKDKLDHFMARFGIRRMKHVIDPGLYAIGKTDKDSPVFVTANYTLSFDALRSSLRGIDGYILVLDTKGINVWCAAGKGTFGTDELIYRIAVTGLTNLVRHRKLIVPQLGATGIASHKVKENSGFTVKFGPVYAKDIKNYLQTGKTSPGMRRIKFTILDRMTVIPVELVTIFKYALIAGILFYFLNGVLSAVAMVTAILASTIIFPILLPWIPTSNFSTKGFILGTLLALPFIGLMFLKHPDLPFPHILLQSTVYLLLVPPISAFIALNFTGATTFTSKTGVEREMFRYIPVMAWMFGSGLVAAITTTIIQNI